MRIVTTAAGWPPSRCETDETFPTSTPAIRTGEPGRMLFADEKTAEIVKWWRNGSDFVKPRYTAIPRTASASSPAAKFEMPRSPRRLMGRPLRSRPAAR